MCPYIKLTNKWFVRFAGIMKYKVNVGLGFMPASAGGDKSFSREKKKYRKIFLPAFMLAMVLWGFFVSVCFAGDNSTQLTLERAIAMALEQNPGFKTSTLGIQAAEHRRKAAGADFLPKVGTSYSYSRLNGQPRMKLPGGFFSAKHQYRYRHAEYVPVGFAYG